jgi:predicted nuclease of predicted toxin-antitoxin system
VTKDSDFQERSLCHGSSPKVVWLRRDNCSTSDVESVLRRHHPDLIAIAADAERSLLELY